MHQLSATTFVQQVDAATLAIIVPVLTLGLREPAAAIKRKAVVIVDNMCKLVGIPEYIEPFLPLLAPGVEKVMKETPDPEVRGGKGRVSAGAQGEGIRRGAERAIIPRPCCRLPAGALRR